MPSNSTLIATPDSDAIRAIGFIGLALFSITSIVAALLYLFHEHFKENVRTAMLALAALLLGIGWLIVGVNPFQINGAFIGRVIFNAMVWYWTVEQFLDFYECKGGLQRKSVRVATVACLVFLFFTAFGERHLRLIGFISLFVLIPTLILAASRWAGEGRSIRTQKGGQNCDCFGDVRGISEARVFFACFSLVGVLALILEALSHDYSRVIPEIGEFVAMLVVHLCLLVLWTWTALMPRGQPKRQDDVVIMTDGLLNDTKPL
jgi:hypothetical protein